MKDRDIPLRVLACLIGGLSVMSFVGFGTRAQGEAASGWALMGAFLLGFGLIAVLVAPKK
jgi:formate/nitrite transporter FocA (FNT family)